MSLNRIGISLLVVFGLGLSLGLFSVPASAASCPAGSPATVCAPGWVLTSQTYPTNLPPGGRGTIVVDVLNVGEGASEGTVTVTDTLPPGLTAVEAGFVGAPAGTPVQGLGDCGGIGTSVVTCTNDSTNLPHLAAGASVP